MQYWKKWLLAPFLLAALATPALAEDDFAEESSDFESDDFAEDSGSEAEVSGLEFTGFLELQQGGNINTPGPQTNQVFMDSRRFRLQTSRSGASGAFYVKLDLVEDNVTNQSEVDVREARIKLTPFEWMDLSLGKQVNTWGVADMLFINDLFPKNWVANFLGQSMEDMKDSANSYRMTTYFGNTTFDLVYHPEFAPDTTPTGCRFAVYNPNVLLDSTQSKLVTDTSTCGVKTDTGRDTGKYNDSETAARLQLKAGDFDLALYTYDGFYKNPKGLTYDGSTLSGYYPALHVNGLSAEGQLGPGIFTFEAGLYDSKEDTDGDNAFIENSATKTLVGYRLDMAAWFSFGLQAYQETMANYANYETSIVTLYQNFGMTAAQAKLQDAYIYRKEEVHNTYTLRMTFKVQQETLWINTFVYARPEDHDNLVKFDVTKRVDNNLELAMGTNIFGGDANYADREFGMFQDQDNAFMRVRYNY